MVLLAHLPALCLGKGVDHVVQHLGHGNLPGLGFSAVPGRAIVQSLQFFTIQTRPLSPVHSPNLDTVHRAPFSRLAESLGHRNLSHLR